MNEGTPNFENVVVVRPKGRPRAFDREAALIEAVKVFWQKGFGPTSISDLCEAMKINPPSLYAAFGSKTNLFIEAIKYYEETYWFQVWERMKLEPSVHKAIEDVLLNAVINQTTENLPRGCLVVLAGNNLPSEYSQITDLLTEMRDGSRQLFSDRLKQGVMDGQLPSDLDTEALARALNAVMQGMSIQASDGLSRSKLNQIAHFAIAMLPKSPCEEF